MKTLQRIITIWVDGQPRPKQSFRYSKKGHYQPAAVAAWQDQVAWAAKVAMQKNNIDMLEGILSIKMRFQMGDKKVRDLDNLSKAVLDAMQGIVYLNDNKVHTLHLQKTYKPDEPGVWISILEYRHYGESELSELSTQSDSQETGTE